MKIPFFWIALLFLAATSARADTSMDDVSGALLKEFFSTQSPSKDAFNLETKNLGDGDIESVTFLIGDKVYKIVIFSDGKLTLGAADKGDLAFTSILESSTRDTSPARIVRLIRSFQKNPATGRAYQDSKDKVDEAGKKSNDASKILKWNKIIDQARAGQSTSISTDSDSSLEASISAAKMLNACTSRGKSAPQKAASENLAQALALANLASLRSQKEGFSENSREYEKKGQYSFFEEMSDFNDSSPERAFQLMQRTKNAEYEIFETSLKKSNVANRDPYFLAANRNFMFLVRTVGKEKTLALMESGMKKIAISVEKFVEYRKMLPESSVVYDRKRDRYFIDPTLNQPTQARYLLSLVSMFEWKNSEKEFQAVLERLGKNPDSLIIDEARDSYRSFLKSTSHPRF